MDERELEKKVETIERHLNQLLTIMEAQQETIAQNAAEIKCQEQRIAKNKKDLENFTCNIRYEMWDNKGFEDRYWYPKIMDQQLTLKNMIEQKKSYFRFTESELNILLHLEEEVEVENDEDDKRLKEIREKLHKILCEESDKYMIALPNIFGNLDQYKMSSRKKFRDYLNYGRRRALMDILPQHKNYHDAIMMHPNEYDESKSEVHTEERYRKLLPLWKGKKIVAVTMPNFGLTKENPYFQGADSFVAVEIPAVDAYKEYDQILQKCLQENTFQTIYLLAAGPVGVLLGADLCKNGLQAVDIGTLGKRYMEFAGNVTE